MTGGFAEEADKGFAGITKDPTDSTFEYRFASESEESGLTATNLRECYSEKCDDWSEGSFRITYGDWEKENVLRKNPKKVFGAPYEEKGSGTSGVHRASYKNFADYPA